MSHFFRHQPHGAVADRPHNFLYAACNDDCMLTILDSLQETEAEIEETDLRRAGLPMFMHRLSYGEQRRLLEASDLFVHVVEDQTFCSTRIEAAKTPSTRTGTGSTGS